MRMRILCLWALPLLVGCFDPDTPPCAYACGPNGECPSGYGCLGDGYCHRHSAETLCGFPDASVAVDMNEGSDAGPTCTDGVKNGDETDVDCGGSVCGKCANTLGCTLATDCVSGVCSTSTCAAPTCSDGVKNGTETDTDCGSSCSGCANGKHCAVGGDCTSTFCNVSSLVCVSTGCLDGTKDGDETDVDCGGSCPACLDGRACSGMNDCASKVCGTQGGSMVCLAATCMDGVQNGGETATDCGHVCTTKCATGQACVDGTDCTSGTCVMLTSLCL